MQLQFLFGFASKFATGTWSWRTRCWMAARRRAWRSVTLATPRYLFFISPLLFSYGISFERDIERALSCLTCHAGKTKILTRNCAAFSHTHTAYWTRAFYCLEKISEVEPFFQLCGKIAQPTCWKQGKKAAHKQTAALHISSVIHLSLTMFLCHSHHCCTQSQSRRSELRPTLLRRCCLAGNMMARSVLWYVPSLLIISVQ